MGKEGIAWVKRLAKTLFCILLHHLLNSAEFFIFILIHQGCGTEQRGCPVGAGNEHRLHDVFVLRNSFFCLYFFGGGPSLSYIENEKTLYKNETFMGTWFPFWEKLRQAHP